MSRSEQYKAEGRAAITSLRDFLYYVIASPGEFATRSEIIKALGSQAGMLSLDTQIDTNKGSIKLTPVSVNTAKKYASMCLPQGFETLEKLREEALSLVIATTSTPSKKITKEGLKIQKSKLESEIESLINSNFNLLQCISIAMSALETTRTERDAQQREKIILDTSATLKSALSINAPPFNSPLTETNVTPIGKGRPRR
jgi:hypothetical protein